MRDWDAARIARAASAHLVGEPTGTAIGQGPRRVTIDSREVMAGDLFIGLRGARADGGAHAGQALEAGAWGVLVAPEHVHGALAARPHAAVFEHYDPLVALGALARSWRRELGEGGTRVAAITGSTGKTSTKDILAAILAKEMRTVSSPQNFNTEVGLPLAVLGAPSGTEALVLEMAMRGAGQIAGLTAIAEPDIGVIVNVGPVHLELLGTLEAIAAAKAELIAGLSEGASVVVPVDEPLLAEHLRRDVRTVTFGDGGDFALEAGSPSARSSAAPGEPRSPSPELEVVIREGDGFRLRAGRDAADAAAGRIKLKPSFRQEHNLRNLLAAVAAARVLGATPRGRVDVRFSELRGERLAMRDGVVLINDCYNANPMSVRAAIDDLADTAPARRVAVLGDMLELGPDASRFHREVGEHAATRGVDLLVTVGALGAEIGEGFAGEAHAVPDAGAAAELLETLLREGDTVLVKGSRGVGLERVAETLGARAGKARESYRGASVGQPSAGPGRS